jgi:hypothetical protein
MPLHYHLSRHTIPKCLPTNNKQCEGFVGLKSSKETQRILLKTIAWSQNFEKVRIKKLLGFWNVVLEIQDSNEKIICIKSDFLNKKIRTLGDVTF